MSEKGYKTVGTNRELVIVQRQVTLKMKVFLFLALAILASAHADEEEQHDYMYFPDEDGIPHLIDLAEKPRSDVIFPRNIDTITFNLFTRNNPTVPQTLVLNSVASVTASNWSSNRQTRFITHGWRSSQTAQACTAPRDAYLAVGDYNVIVIDWSQIAGQLYVSAAPSVGSVANHVALMIDFLHQSAGLDYATTKIAGHSLGGHIAGLAARAASGTLQAVIALDPALPLFNSAGPGSRVDASDASHVQVIHTNGGLLGIMDAIGDSDFYPNGGKSQPGCGVDVVGSCAHSRAYLFFAESILNPTGFPGVATRSSDRSAFGRYDVFMGGRQLTTHASGSFYVTTGRSSPFALD